MGSHKMRTVTGSWIRFACCSVVLSSTLAACGGGSSGSTSAQTSTPDTPVVTEPSSPSTPATPGSANSAPTISGTAQASATAGQGYSFTPQAADADKDAVTFTIANKPAWAAFNASTGALTGTPAATDVGNYAGIEIAATDGKAVTALPTFAITVSAATATNNVSVSWSPPTQNADGSTLTDLAGYKIHYGTQAGAYTGNISVNNAGLTRYELDSLPKGKIFIAMTAVNSAGAESDYSSEVSVTVN
jgi:putative Ig domain-containing protein